VNKTLEKSKHRILFIEPALFRPRASDNPLNPAGLIERVDLSPGLLSLASYINSTVCPAKVLLLSPYFEIEKEETRFYDGTGESEAKYARMAEEILKGAIGETEPNVAGISIASHQMEYGARVVIRALRKLIPGIKIVLGGVHVTFTARKWFETYVDEQPDFVVMGEGEEALASLIENDFEVTGEAPGLMCRNTAGEIISGGLAPCVDLSRCSAPYDYGLCVLPREYGAASLFRMIQFTRGCVGTCSYCVSPALSGGRIRERPLSLAEKDLNGLKHHLPGGSLVFVWDDMFMPSRKFYRDACGVMRKIGCYRYQVSSSFNYLKPEDIDMFGASDIRNLLIGLQHTDPDVLRNLGRGAFDPDKTVLLIEKCRSNDIAITLDLLLGCTGSTFQKDMEMLENIKRMKDRGLAGRLSVKIVQPYPGTRIASDPHVRIIEPDMSRWDFHRASHEILDTNKNVVYHKSEIEETYRLFSEVILSDVEKRPVTT